MDRALLHEEGTYEDPAFPVRTYRFRCDANSNVFTCHWHEEAELLVVTEGVMLLQLGDHNHRLEAGQAAFINSGELHAGHCDEGQPFSFLAVVFDRARLFGSGEACGDIAAARFSPPFLTPVEEQWGPAFARRIGQVRLLCEQKPDRYELLVLSTLYALFHEMLTRGHCAPPEKGDGDRSERVKRALRHIAAHYQERITVGELAALVGVSPGHFCAFFKRMTGRTLIDYVNFYRIQRAAELLRGGDRKILAVAMDVGFDNYSYFIHCFKRYTGMTPQAYRRQAV